MRRDFAASGLFVRKLRGYSVSNADWRKFSGWVDATVARRKTQVLPVPLLNETTARRVAIRQPVKPGPRKVVEPIGVPATGAKGERMLMQQYRSNSYLFGGNAPYVEELYEAYLDNPGSVPDNWRAYFDNLQHVPAVDGSDSRDVAHAPVVESFAQRAKANAFALKASSADLAVAQKQVHVQSLIAAYRFWVRAGPTWIPLSEPNVPGSLSLSPRSTA